MMKSFLEEELLQIQLDIRKPYDAWVQKLDETNKFVFASELDHAEIVTLEESKPFFPKTPTNRKGKKRPLVPTIVEDDEESVWAHSPTVEVLRVRGSRAASKNANLKLKEVKLNAKLRRPSKLSVIECPATRTTRTTQSTICLSSPDVFSDSSVEVPTIIKKQKQHDISLFSDDDDVPLQTLVKPTKKQKRVTVKKENVPPPKDNEEYICEKEATVCVERMNEATINSILKRHDIPEPAVVNKLNKEKVMTRKEEDSLPPKDMDVDVCDKSAAVPAKRVVEAAVVGALNRRDAQPHLSVKKRVNEYERLVGVEPTTPGEPPVRMTRTKMRKLASDNERREAQQQTSDSTTLKLAAQKLEKFIQVKQGRENVEPDAGKQGNKSVNNIVTSVDSFLPKLAKVAAENIEEKRKDELKRRKEKEAEAAKKKKEMTDLKIEMQKKKREEKFQKVQMSREAMEREKLEQLSRIEREKEERARQQLEREEKLREELLKKKQQAQQKALEMEERRRQDEIARLARLKEQEEEQQRILAQRKREEEEAARQHQKRLKEEREAAAVREAMEKKEKLLKMKAAKKAVAEEKQLDGTFVVEKNEVMPAVRPPLKAFSEENYELQDLSEGDSDDENDDVKNKHRIPKWVTHPSMNQLCRIQNAMKLSAVDVFFGSHATTPNLSEMFDNPKLGIIPRSSSAVWRTPPRYSCMPKP